jgi:FAD/FMN-containing dehydrogenase
MRKNGMDADPIDEVAAEAARGAGLGRREFLSGAAMGALAGWLPAFRVSPASAQATCAPPPDFPSDIPLYQQAYQNWSREIQISSLWTCAPRNPNDVLRIVNWAHNHSYKVRPRGKMHNWSPLTVSSGATCAESVVLLDTTQSLTSVSIDSAASTVTAQTGITMEALLTALENAGLGLTATPAPGDLTLGGVLAIDGHGTAVPANGEVRPAGHTYGSVSNLILSLTAIVWDSASSQYVSRTFARTDPQSRAFLVHVGRAFITEVTLRVGANQRLRCQSWFDIPASELFAPQGSSGRTFVSYLDSAGRAEAIWFPFTSNPWLKVWSVTPSKPFFSREVTSPYNYSFSDSAPQAVTDLFAQILNGDPSAATTLGPVQYGVVAAGLVATFTYDIWGWSKNLLLYIKPTTLRVTANGYAVLMNRSNVQRALNEFATFYQGRIAAYQASGQYPANGPVEIRVTGLDQAADVGRDGAGAGQLSALRPRPDHPDWNVAVWFDILTVPGTPAANEFYRDIEQWMLSNYSGSYAAVRPEWSKGWGYTAAAAWSDATILTATLPNAYRAGQPSNDNWDTARATLNQYDPHRVFSSPLPDSLLP